MSSASRGLAPREGLGRLLVKTGRTGPRVEPSRGSQAAKSGDPRSQNADRRDPTTAKFEGRPLVQVILTRGGLLLPKALVVTMSWAPW